MIKIATLYADLLNLYGDYANIAALQKRLENTGEPVAVTPFSVGDELDLTGYDFLFAGSGTEPALFAALGDLQKKADAIQSYVEHGGIALFTGNALALLAGSITKTDGSASWGLRLCDFDVSVLKTRSYTEYGMKTPLVDCDVVGAINSSLSVTPSATPFFAVQYATDKAMCGTVEGFAKGNLFATQLCGPLLVRNPALLDAFAGLLCGGPVAPCEDTWYQYLQQGYLQVSGSLRAACAKR